jgi:hypothetical protein
VLDDAHSSSVLGAFSTMPFLARFGADRVPDALDVGSHIPFITSFTVRPAPSVVSASWSPGVGGGVVLEAGRDNEDMNMHAGNSEFRVPHHLLQSV